MSIKSKFNLTRAGVDIDEPGLEGETYLTRAVKMQQHEAIRDFLKLGANANAENAHGERPIYIALELKDAKAIDILVAEGNASVFVKKDGLTFKENAEKAGVKEAVERADIAERMHKAYTAALSQRGF